MQHHFLRVLDLHFCWQVAEKQQQREVVVVVPDAITREWVEQALKDIEANKVRQTKRDLMIGCCLRRMFCVCVFGRV
jgi:hypothetical protein